MSNGYDAQDMATQGADGFRNGYQAGYADAVKAVEVGKPAAAQEAVAIEKIAQQWDGCMFDSVGETIDIGEAIRAAGKRLAPVAAAPVDLGHRYDVILSALMARRPEGHTFANIREIEWMAEGVHAALVATPAAPGIDLPTAIRNCCEAEKADPDHPDTICINVNELSAIMQQCVIDASPKGGSYAAGDTVLLPIEPTREMLAQFYRVATGADWSANVTPLTNRQFRRASLAYRAMIEVAALQATSAEVGS